MSKNPTQELPKMPARSQTNYEKYFADRKRIIKDSLKKRQKYLRK